MPVIWLSAALAFGQQDRGINELFYKNVPRVAASDRGSQTFVIWVNGDAEHFQGETSLGEGPSGDTLFRVDAYEVARIKKTAALCTDCNVVILHDQRGSDAWYTASGPWGVWLTVIAKGKIVSEVETAEVNGTDTDLLATLIRYSRFIFPSTTTHLVYRGHPFSPQVPPNPKNDPENGPLAFDYSHPDFRYGVDDFAKSLKDAGVDREPLATLTFASCRMATLEVFASVERFADFTIAPQFDFLETLEASFGYAFLRTVASWMTSETQADEIAYYAMRRFDTTKYIEEAKDEYPITVVRNDRLNRPLRYFEESLNREWAQLDEKDRSALREKAILKRTHSTRYENDKAQTLGRSKSEKLTELYRAPLVGPPQLDLGHTLEWFKDAQPTWSEREPFEHWMIENSWFYYGRFDGSISGITLTLPPS